MSSASRGAAQAARELADAFEAAMLPYAIGGALALAIAGVPRGTADVDVNVFVGLEALPAVLATLRRLGLHADDAETASTSSGCSPSATTSTTATCATGSST